MTKMAKTDQLDIDNELQGFVTSSLVAIMRGVSDAQVAARAPSAHGTGVWGFSPPEDVAFDIAVVAKRTKTAKGGLKVEVFSIGANAGAGAASEHSHASRIQFTIKGSLNAKRPRKQTRLRQNHD